MGRCNWCGAEGKPQKDKKGNLYFDCGALDLETHGKARDIKKGISK